MVESEKKILRLPVNECWYGLLKDGVIKFDYREIKPFWTKRILADNYNVAEFYHRFKKDIVPMQFEIKQIGEGMIHGYPNKVYLILLGDRIS